MITVRRFLGMATVLAVLGLAVAIVLRPAEHDAFLGFAPERPLLVLARKYGDVELWDLTDTTPRGSHLSLRRHGRIRGETVTFVDDNTLVAMCDTGDSHQPAYEVLFWSVAEDKPLTSLPLPYDAYCDFFPSHDGQWLLVHRRDLAQEQIDVWNLAERKLERSHMLPQLPVFLTVSGDTTTFAFWTYHDRDSVQIWDRDSRQATRRLAVPWGVHVILSPDGSLLAHQRLGGVVIHKLSAGDPLSLSSGDEERHVPLKFSRDGRCLITRCDDLTYLHWDSKNGAPTRVPFTGYYQVALSPRGDTLAVFNIQQSAVWRVADNEITVLPELSRRLVPSPYVFVIVLLGLGWIWGMLRLSGTRGRALSAAPPVTSETLTAEIVDE